MLMSQTNRMCQTIEKIKATDVNPDSTTIVEDLEVEDDSLEIMTIDHDDQFNTSDAIKKDTDMWIAHTKTEPT